MVSKGQKTRIMSIVKTLLLCQGPLSARDMCSFINCNKFCITNLTPQELSSLLKEHKKSPFILADLKWTADSPRLYYLEKRR